MPALYLLGFVPLYSALTALWSFQPLRSVELPVMVFISTAGYFANSLANKFIFDRSDVVSAIGAFVIGWARCALPCTADEEQDDEVECWEIFTLVSSRAPLSLPWCPVSSSWYR